MKSISHYPHSLNTKISFVCDDISIFNFVIDFIYNKYLYNNSCTKKVVKVNVTLKCC